MSRERLEELRKKKRLAELRAKRDGAAAAPAPAPEPQPAPQPEEPGLGAKALDYGLRALDYAGGLGRTAATGYVDIARAIMGQPAISQPGDAMAALRGQAPTVSERLERGGVGDMGSVGIPFTDMKVTGRDAVGFAGDVLTDPLTYASLGASAVAKAGQAGKVAAKATTPMQELTRKIGEMTYRSGLKNVDKEVSEYGGKKLSKVLLDEGAPTGSMKQVKEYTEQVLVPKYDATRKDLYAQVDSGGATVDASFAQDKAREVINRMRQDPGLRDKANAMSEFVDKYTQEGAVTVQQMSDWKTNLYNALPDAAFNPDRTLSNWGKKVQKALSEGFKDEIENAGNFVRKGLGDDISKVNEKWGTVLQSQKPMAREARKAETVDSFTSVDAILTGAMAADPVMAGGALALKKGADAAKTTGARTRVGKGLMSVAPWADPAGRRAIIDSQRQPENRAGIGAWQSVQTMSN